MRIDADRLLALLPAVYRSRDRQGELRALLEVIARQINVLEEDLAQLYDDQFIETCAAWVIPYIGDLLANTPLFDGGRDADAQPRGAFPDLTGPRFVPRVALRARADVAKTIFYRKRKATLPMLEELAGDVTGWAAHVVEMFELLRWNQCVRNHVRMFSKGQPDLRRAEVLDRLNGPFDSISHTVDVRPIGQLEGWHETRNVAFFLWRLRSYAVDGSDARRDSGYRFRFNRMGIDARLFTRSRRAESGGRTELDVPGPIRQSLFRDDLRRHRALPLPRPAASDVYGIPERSLSIVADGTLVPPEDICPADLSTWRRSPGKIVTVDVKRGRIAFGDAFGSGPADVRVSYHHGFSADLGGGSYPRAAWLIKRELAERVIPVAKGTATDTIAKALATWVAEGRPNAVITVNDNRTYDEPGTLILDPPAEKFLAIEADEGRTPHIRLANPIEVACGDEAVVTLSGLLMEGRISVTKLDGRLRIVHSTLAPSGTAPSITTTQAIADAVDVDRFRAEIAFSIVGAIRLPQNGRGLSIYDSIVDGAGTPAISGINASDPGPALRIERSTVFGEAHVRELPMGSEVIFTGKLHVVRRQQGCARFSFLPRDSRAPRPYRCQPALEIRTRTEAARRKKGSELTAAELSAIADPVHAFLVPSFTSTRYGDDGYAQLHLRAPLPIARGAEDGSEMGVFCHLKQPQRENNLRTRLREYLPFGLEPGLIYVT